MWFVNPSIGAFVLLYFTSIGSSSAISHHPARAVDFHPSHTKKHALGKRVEEGVLPPGYPKLNMRKYVDGAKTYRGTIEEWEFKKANKNGLETIEGYVPCDINPMEWEDLDLYASNGYKQIGSEFTDDVVLVTAQYTPGIGLSVWSKPRDEAAVKALWALGEIKYPKYMKWIGERTKADGTPPQTDKEREKLMHAEDAAAIGSASRVQKVENEHAKSKKAVVTQMRRATFGKNTRATTYGKFSKSDKAEVKPPCGTDGTEPKFSPNCLEMSEKSNIEVTAYKGPLGRRPTSQKKGAKKTAEGEPGAAGEDDKEKGKGKEEDKDKSDSDSYPVSEGWLEDADTAMEGVEKEKGKGKKEKSDDEMDTTEG
jgi:hypothetical protein